MATHLLGARESSQGGILATGMPVMLAKAPVSARSHQSLRTFQSFRRSALASTPQSDSLALSFSHCAVSYQKSTFLEPRCTRNLDLNCAAFSSWSTLSPNALRVISHPVSLFSSLASAGLCYASEESCTSLSSFAIPLWYRRTSVESASFTSSTCPGSKQLLSRTSERERRVHTRSISGEGRGYVTASPIPLEELSIQLNDEIVSEVVVNNTSEATTTVDSNGESSSADLSTDGFVRGAVVATEGSVGDEQEILGGQRSKAFEQWALKKLNEDGPAALSVIEELRQTFAPGSPSLDPQMRGVSQLKTNGSSERDDRKNRSASEKVSRSKMEPWKASTRSEFGKPGSVRGGRPSRSHESGSLNSGTSAKTDAPLPEPFIVKRSTTFPGNWNGRGGSVLLVDKPQGVTSFGICSKLRHLLKIQKVGHAGTLDPLATGLLIVCLGNATKRADSFQAMTKVYSGTIRLGELTPSLDSDTEVSDVLPWEHITDADLEKAKTAFLGDILQSPPMFSAVKINGERLYKKARRGEEIEVPPRQVSVIDFQIERSSVNRQEISFRVTCSKGTYVRSLCADLGRAVGSYAHLTALRREKIGDYSVKDAWPIPDFEEEYHSKKTMLTFRT